MGEKGNSTISTIFGMFLFVIFLIFSLMLIAERGDREAQRNSRRSS